MNSFVRYNERAEIYEKTIIHLAQVADAGVCYIYVSDYCHDLIYEPDRKSCGKAGAHPLDLHYVLCDVASHFGIITDILRQNTVDAHTDGHQLFSDARLDHHRCAVRKL